VVRVNISLRRNSYLPKADHWQAIRLYSAEYNKPYKMLLYIENRKDTYIKGISHSSPAV